MNDNIYFDGVKQSFETHDINFPSKDGTIVIKGKVYILPPNAQNGYKCGYSLFIPNGCQVDTTLIVHCCNTGGAGVTDGKLDNTKPAIHLSEGNKAALLSTLKINPGMWLGSDLKMPVLIPLIPRVRGYYTQALGSKVFENDVSTLIEDNMNRSIENKLSNQEILEIQEQCRDLPSQLSNIIFSAKKTLNDFGINVDDKVIMEGYSAGSKFANCFTALHPELVKACISGGTSGLGILPITQLKGQTLNFPLGVANIPNFNAQAFKSIPQYFYIGNDDKNDPAMINNDSPIKFQPKFKENYTSHEIMQIHTLLGTDLQTRFKNSQQIYSQLRVNARFEIFAGDHNSVTNQRDSTRNYIVNESVKNFIKEVISKEKDVNKSFQNDEQKTGVSFYKMSQSEIQAYNLIEEKNQLIHNEKMKQRELYNPMVRTLNKNKKLSSNNNGFISVILLSLIVSFLCGILFSTVYIFLTKG